MFFFSFVHEVSKTCPFIRSVNSYQHKSLLKPVPASHILTSYITLSIPFMLYIVLEKRSFHSPNTSQQCPQIYLTPHVVGRPIYRIRAKIKGFKHSYILSTCFDRILRCGGRLEGASGGLSTLPLVYALHIATLS